MPPLAICSSLKCDYALVLQDVNRGISIAPPRSCPKCQCAIITRCPQCRFLIVGLVAERQQACRLCHVDLRSAFVERLRAAADLNAD